MRQSMSATARSLRSSCSRTRASIGVKAWIPAFATMTAGAFARTVAAAMLLCSTFPVFADDIPKEWLAPQLPVRLLGNTYYVGTRGLASILITSDEGHVLIDGGLIDSAPLIAANIQTLGFKLEDVRTILHSHAHFDHVGGLAELQRLTGADVVSSKAGAEE